MGFWSTLSEFDLGWPWGVRNEGHTFWREICRTATVTMLDVTDITQSAHGLHFGWPWEVTAIGVWRYLDNWRICLFVSVAETDDSGDQTSVGDSTVRFCCAELTHEGQWHHLAAVIHKASIMKNSSVSLFIDGDYVATQKVRSSALLRIASLITAAVQTTYQMAVVTCPFLSWNCVEFFWQYCRLVNFIVV